MLSAVTIISTASWYPLRAVLASVAPVVDEIIVNVDATDTSGTLQLVDAIAQEYPLRKVVIPWDWSAKDKGQELARQTNLAINEAQGDWILHIQADEILHENEHAALQEYVRNAPMDVTGFRLTRLYFFKTLRTLRTDWTVPLIRLFRKNTHVVDGDAMDTRTLYGRILTAHGVALYHYSRVGDSKIIVDRIMKLSSLYHEEDTLHPPTEYDFATHVYDSFSTDNPPAPVDPDDVLMPFIGTHPKYALEYFAPKVK